jgi:hypothetical protein
LCDQIWYARNKAVHAGSIPDISSLASSIRRSALVKEFWSPPPAGSYKINFDTAIHDSYSVQFAEIPKGKSSRPLLKLIILVSLPTERP